MFYSGLDDVNLPSVGRQPPNHDDDDDDGFIIDKRTIFPYSLNQTCWNSLKFAKLTYKKKQQQQQISPTLFYIFNN